MRKSEVVKMIFLLWLVLFSSTALANNTYLIISSGENLSDGYPIEVKLTLLDAKGKQLAIKKDQVQVFNNQVIYQFDSSELEKEMGIARNRLANLKALMIFCKGCEKVF